jgi:2-methylisocitrate lyase-like PEP mutase family enzyme
LDAKRLKELGFSITIFHATGFLAAGTALERAYQTLQDTGPSEPVLGDLYDFDRFSRLMGFERIWEFERAHAD